MTDVQHRGRPALVAQFGSPGDARAAIEALEHHGIDGVGTSDEWEQTFHEPRTIVVPAEIYTDSAEEAARARHVLEEHRPLTLREQSGAAR